MFGVGLGLVSGMSGWVEAGCEVGFELVARGQGLPGTLPIKIHTLVCGWVRGWVGRLSAFSAYAAMAASIAIKTPAFKRQIKL